MKHPLRWVVVGVGSIVAVLGVVLATQVNSSPTYVGGPILGKPAPAFDLPVLGAEPGTRVRLADLAGKSVIVNFWNSWCIPCQQELPSLQAFWAAHRGDPSLVMVGIVRDDSDAAAAAYGRTNGMTWTLASDPGSKAALDFGTSGQPETYAINPQGIVTGKQLSAASEANLDALLQSARQVLGAPAPGGGVG